MNYDEAYHNYIKELRKILQKYEIKPRNGNYVIDEWTETFTFINRIPTKGE